jgi:hypothetical protein
MSQLKVKSVHTCSCENFPFTFYFIHFRDQSGDRDGSTSEFPESEELVLRTRFEILASKLEALMLTSARRY